MKQKRDRKIQLSSPSYLTSPYTDRTRNHAPITPQTHRPESLLNHSIPLPQHSRNHQARLQRGLNQKKLPLWQCKCKQCTFPLPHCCVIVIMMIKEEMQFNPFNQSSQKEVAPISYKKRRYSNQDTSTRSLARSLSQIPPMQASTLHCPDLLAAFPPKSRKKPQKKKMKEISLCHTFNRQ